MILSHTVRSISRVIGIFIKGLSVLLIISVLTVTCTGCSSNKTPEGLTPAQKERDFRYLTDLISKAYPFNEFNVNAKGLSDINALSGDYIKRARNTKDDREFMELFEEYLTRLSQTGHAYLVTPVYLDYLKTASEDYKQYFNLYTDINKVAREKVVYWSNIDTSIPKQGFVQPEVKISYENGKYVIAEDKPLISSVATIPRGSIIERIEGKSADDYIKSLQSKVHLSFDYKENKLYLANPLILLPTENSSSWNIGFKLPDGSSVNERVSVDTQYDVTANVLDAVYPNAVTAELNESTGYIKVFGMGIGTGDTADDKKAINEFLKQSKGKYKKLIIDIRGNPGGDPAYWMDLLVAPLIKSSIRYTQTAAVKNDFIELWDTNFQQYLGTKQGLLSQRLHFSAVKEAMNSPYFDKSWRVFDVTREIEPKDNLPFNGEIYLLADENSFSASEDFAYFSKGTGFAKIAGTRTGGGAAVLLLSHIFALPESKILFCVEMEAALNPDGTINEITGTAPDIPLEPQAAPTSYKLNALLEDKWIQRIMEEP